MTWSRRDFLKRAAFGTAGIALGTGIGRTAAADKVAVQNATVSLTSGNNRKQNIINALLPLKNAITAGIIGKTILVKPNLVLSDQEAMVLTHPDAIRGVLDFLRTITDKKIIIGEASGDGKTATSFTKYGYDALIAEYNNVELLDIISKSSTFDFDNILIDGKRTRGSIKVYNEFGDENYYVISVPVPKTHSHALVTLGLKNVLMAAPHKIPPPSKNVISLDARYNMHANQYSAENGRFLTENIVTLAHRCMPDLSVIDGFEGCEGDGPTSNGASDAITKVGHHVAVASTDAVAADLTFVRLMGIDPLFAAHVRLCGDAGLGQSDSGKITVVGERVEDHIIPYKLHRNAETIKSWCRQFFPATSIMRIDHAIAPALAIPNYIGYAGRDVTMSLFVPQADRMRVRVFNTRGQVVSEPLNGFIVEGRYDIHWSGRDHYGAFLPAGQYAVCVEAGQNMITQRMTVVR
jgi:uncharacterized protein (DUF362 family)